MSKFVVVVAALVIGAVMFVLPNAGFVGASGEDGDTTIMQFGRPDLGSGCGFGCDDDASFHAVDKVQPGAVHIAAGDTVWFDVQGFHQIAVYKTGIKPKDIEPQGPGPFVNDDNDRVGLGLLTVDFDFTFDEPGKYLVICNITPHFEESQMWGWVTVQ